MVTISEFKEFFGEWIAAVAGAVDVVADRVMRPRRILLLEGDDGAFTATTAPTENGPALPELSFRLDQGRPHPPLPADWEAAFRGASSRPSCNPITSLCVRSIFQVRPAGSSTA